MNNKFFTRTSFRKSTGDKDYNRQRREEAVSSMKALIRKIEKEQLMVESVGFWQEATPDKFTFQIHVKES